MNTAVENGFQASSCKSSRRPGQLKEDGGEDGSLIEKGQEAKNKTMTGKVGQG